MAQVLWVVQSGSLEAAHRHKVKNIHSSPSHSSRNLAPGLTCCGGWKGCGCLLVLLLPFLVSFGFFGGFGILRLFLFLVLLLLFALFWFSPHSADIT